VTIKNIVFLDNFISIFFLLEIVAIKVFSHHVFALHRFCKVHTNLMNLLVYNIFEHLLLKSVYIVFQYFLSYFIILLFIINVILLLLLFIDIFIRMLFLLI